MNTDRWNERAGVFFCCFLIVCLFKHLAIERKELVTVLVFIREIINLEDIKSETLKPDQNFHQSKDRTECECKNNHFVLVFLFL